VNAMTDSGIEELTAYVRANRPRNASVEELRAWWSKLVQVTPIPTEAKLEPSTCPVAASWIQLEGIDAGRVILYFHGGAFVIGSPETHLETVYRLAKASSARALTVDYRLLPENPYPACLDDALAAYRYLLQEGVSSSRIAIAGDSAGGGITMSTALAIRDAGLPLPGCLVGFSPWVDFSASGQSVQTNGPFDPMVDPRMLPVIAQVILGDRDRVSASPLFANLAGLPPLFVQVGTREVLYDEGRLLAERFKEAGGDAVLDEWAGMNHVFQMFPTLVPGATTAIERAGSFVREKLG
jgi:monoterpene epsilon-lactone hydrolase